MSKIALTPNDSGTGTFTLASPNSNTSRTLTLPDAAGELLTSTGDGSGLTSLTSANLTGALPAIDGSGLTSLTSANLTGALPAIDGSALTGISTTPTTAQVLTATAGAATGAVGTYAALQMTSNGSNSPGYTRAGSGLKYMNFFAYSGAGYQNVSPAGTWRLMGSTGYYQGGANASTDRAGSMWLRIS